MKKNVTYRKVILISVFIITVSIIGICGIFMSYTPSIVTDKIELGKVEEEYVKNENNDRINMSNAITAPILTYDPGDGVSSTISYEDFIADSSLVSLNSSFPIPYIKYRVTKGPRPVKEDTTIEGDPLRTVFGYPRDATLNTFDVRGDNASYWSEIITSKGGQVEVKTFEEASKIYGNPITYENEQNKPNYTNSFGSGILLYSKTLAQYTAGKSYAITGRDAWMLAYSEASFVPTNSEQKGKGRIDRVQSAMWLAQGTYNRIAIEQYYTNRIDVKEVAQALVDEASLSQSEPLKVTDNFADKYGTEVAGVVSYGEYKDENSGEILGEFLVGPFSIDYNCNSSGKAPSFTKVVNNGEIIFNGIIDANIYGILDGSEQKLDKGDWEFVYKDIKITNGAISRNGTIYPSPNEEFYIKLKRFCTAGEINAVSKIEFDFQSFGAKANVKKLTGSYDLVSWNVGVDYSTNNKEAQYRTETREEQVPVYIWVTEWVNFAPGDTLESLEEANVSTREKKDSSGNFVKDSNGKQVYEKDSGREVKVLDHYDTQSYEEDVFDHYTYNHTFTPYVEPRRVRTETAAPLYKVLDAEIYLQKIKCQIAVGNKHDDYPLYNNYCIPLTMDIGGTVWIDGDEIKQLANGVNGKYDSGEETKVDVGVYLYEYGTNKPIASTQTGADGKYIFKYVQVGPNYYVKFKYDWMKYKSTTGIQNINDFSENPENYLLNSHAVETIARRKAFNSRFYEITTDTGVSRGGSSEKLTYSYENETGTEYSQQVAKVGEVLDEVSTADCGIILPMQTKYTILRNGR